METETELKFKVSPRQLTAIHKRRLAGVQRLDSVDRRLVSTYFDTKKWKLKQEGIVLRVREGEGGFVQTVKADKPGSAARGEWETDIDDRRPDLSKVGATPLNDFKLKKLRRKLHPVFRTSVHRTAQVMRSRGSEIELAVDRGKISSGRSSLPIAELEIELKKGKVSELFRIARLLARDMDAELDLASKSEKGFRLLGRQNGAIYAEDIVLDRKAGPGEAFRVIALSTFRHFSQNGGGVRALDGEAVHQMRVGLRRLRAAISLFDEVLPRAGLGQIKAELKWLTDELADARELDVFVTEWIDHGPGQAAPRRGVHAVRERLDAWRRAAFQRARRAVSSPRYRAMLIDLLEWIETMKPAPSSDELIGAFAHRILARRIRKARRQGRDLQALTPELRHRLRIRLKKIRYGIDFLKGLYSPADRKRLAKSSGGFKKIQSALGSLNDFEAHRRIAASVAMTAPPSNRRAQAFTSGFIVGHEQQVARKLIAVAAEQISRLQPLPALK